MARAKIIAAVIIGLLFGMLSIYALLTPQLRVLETELAQTSEQVILQESQIADLKSEKEELAVEKENVETELENLREQVMRFHSAIEDFDVEQVMTFYVNPSTRVDWTGQVGVLGGTYPGWSNVRLLWAALMGNLQDMQITLSHYQADIDGDEALVTYIIINTGRGTLIGDYRMVVSVTTTWSLVEGNWMIEEDLWNFILWEAEIVAITVL